jgi:hypothetical protein
MMHELYYDARIVLWCTNCTIMHELYYYARIVLWCTNSTMMHELYYDARIHERQTQYYLHIVHLLVCASPYFTADSIIPLNRVLLF